MRRSSATTRLIVEVLRMLQETVGVLSDLERGAAMHASGAAVRRVALWKTRLESSRSQFVIVPLRFLTRLNL